MKFFRVPYNPDDDVTESKVNHLQKYIHKQSAQDMSRLASEISQDVRQIIANNVQALLGYLPPQEFQTSITVSKEHLQNLLASSMLTGYFMHAMENRMHMEEVFENELQQESVSELLPSESSDLIQSTLQDPSELFKELSKLNPKALPEELFDKKSGRFLNIEELLHQEEDEALNIQLEINTRMNSSELSRLIKELRSFENQAESNQEPPTEESDGSRFDITEF